MYKIVVALVIIPFFAISQVEKSEEKLESLPNFENQRSIEHWLEENKIPAIGIGIIENGKLSNINVYGNLKKKNRRHITPYSKLLL